MSKTKKRANIAVAHVTDGLLSMLTGPGPVQPENMWLAALEEFDRLHDLLKI